MKKSEIVRQNDLQATTIFVAAAIGLFANSVLSGLQSIMNISSGILLFIQLVALACLIFANVMTIKGFGFVNKACKLSEENENYFFGKNLMIFSIISFILTLILTIAAWLFSQILNQYAVAPSLSLADISAANNLKIILAVILIAAQIVAISTPYIFYLWRIHKDTPKADSLNNFALLAMIVFIVHLAIGVLHSIYSINGGEIAFLASFSRILLIVKYLVLMLFFITRRKFLAAPPEQESDTDSSAGVVDEES